MLGYEELEISFGEVRKGDVVLDRLFAPEWVLVIDVLRDPSTPDEIRLVLSETKEHHSEQVSRSAENRVRVRRRQR